MLCKYPAEMITNLLFKTQNSIVMLIAFYQNILIKKSSNSKSEKNSLLFLWFCASRKTIRTTNFLFIRKVNPYFELLFVISLYV